MLKSSMKYHLVDNGDDDDGQDQPSTKFSSRSSLTLRAILALLAISLLANAGFLIEKLTVKPRVQEERSLYANLARDIPKPFKHTTEYSSENLTQAQEHWDALSFDRGKISMPHEVAAAMKLPPSQPFPWDPTRGLYLLNAHHNIHCLKSLQKTLMEHHLNVPTTYSLQHNMHCLDALRDDTMCHADDTPRYTTDTSEPVSGIGQTRMCRDWDKLEAWAKLWEGCWRYLDESADRRPQLERYLFCPKDSPYYARMKGWAERHPEIRAPPFD